MDYSNTDDWKFEKTTNFYTHIYINNKKNGIILKFIKKLNNNNN